MFSYYYYYFLTEQPRKPQGKWRSWVQKGLNVAELLRVYMILLKCLIVSILLHGARRTMFSFPCRAHRRGKIRMSSEKPSVYKRHKRESNPKRSEITRCFSHSNIKLQRLSCLNWLHKCSHWQGSLRASRWNAPKSDAWVSASSCLWQKKV